MVLCVVLCKCLDSCTIPNINRNSYEVQAKPHVPAPFIAHISSICFLQSGVCCTLYWLSLVWCSSSPLCSGVLAAAISEGRPTGV